MVKLPFHERLYTYGLWSSYILFALTAFGLWNDGEAVLSKLEFGLGIYISLFLLNACPLFLWRTDTFQLGIFAQLWYYYKLMAAKKSPAIM